LAWFSIRIAAAAALLCLLAPATAQAGADGSLEWKSLRSDHFWVHFYQGEEPLAREFLALAEEAYEDLHQRFGFETTEATHLVVVDDIDSANGLTTVVPYNHVLLYSFVPDASGELGFWGDWKRILVYHELVHIFQLERVTGILKILNYFVGKTFLPNGALPNWFTEGLAVEVESTIDSGGRIGGPLFSTYLRLAVAERELLKIDEITGAPLVLPRGTNTYLYGSYFLHWLAARYGTEKLYEFVDEQGAHFNPLSYNIKARRVFGDTFVNLFEVWRTETTAYYEKQIEAIRRAGVREGNRLVFAGEHQPMPSYTARGSILWTRATGHETQHLAELLVDGSVRKLTTCRGGCDRPQEAPDGNIYYSAFRYHRTYYYFQDLVQLPKKGWRKQLTDGERVRDPALSPDGKLVAYGRTELGRSELRIRELSTGKTWTLYETEGSISWPAWSPDGALVAITSKAGPDSDVVLIDVKSGEDRMITAGPSVELHPAFSPDGRHLLFASSRSGVYNIYAHDLTDGCTRQVSNVIGAAYSPTVHPDGERVVFASYHHDGYYLQEIPLLAAECVEIDFGEPPVHPVPGRELAPPEPAKTTDEPQRYNALRHLYPRQWRPSFMAASFDITLLGFETWGNDPVGQLSYTAMGQFNTETSDGYGTLAISLNRWYPTISLFGGFYRSSLWAKANDEYQDYRENDVYGSLALSFPFRHPDYSFSLVTGYALERFTGEITEPWEFDPSSTQPFFPTEGNLGTAWASLSFDTTDSYGYSVTTEQGWAAATELRLSSPLLGSNWTEYQVKWRLAKYTRLRFLDHHVLKTQLRGGWAGGRDTFLRRFSVGGYPDQELFADLLEGVGIGGNFLRGYPPGVIRGSQYHYGSVDYYFPVWRIRRGWQTFPIFLKDLYIDLFGTGAGAFDTFALDDFRFSAGGELRLKILLSHNLPFTLIMGAAYGFQEEGGFQTYFLLGQ
jgi:hypothetical protein